MLPKITSTAYFVTPMIGTLSQVFIADYAFWTHIMARGELSPVGHQPPRPFTGHALHWSCPIKVELWKCWVSATKVFLEKLLN